MVLKIADAAGRQTAQNLFLVAQGRAREGRFEREVDPPSGLLRPGPQNAARQSTRRFDIGRIIEQNQRLERSIGNRALGGAILPRRRVERHQRWMQKASLPMGIEPAAKLIVAQIGLIDPFGEVQFLVVSGGLIWPDALAA